MIRVLYNLIAFTLPVFLISGNQKPFQNGVILYGLNFAGAVYKIDPMTCEVCPVFYPQGNAGSYDLVVLPNVQSRNLKYNCSIPTCLMTPCLSPSKN